MSFLAPILGGLAGPLMGGMFGNKGQQQANQNNQQQQQMAIQQAMQAWQQAMGGFENWMGQNPSPFGGGFNVRQPGQIGANPYQPQQMPAGGIFGGQMMPGMATMPGSQPFGGGQQRMTGGPSTVGGGAFPIGDRNFHQPGGGYTGGPMRPNPGNWWGPGSNWWKNFRAPGEYAEHHPFAGGGGGGFHVNPPHPVTGTPITTGPLHAPGFGAFGGGGTMQPGPVRAPGAGSFGPPGGARMRPF